MKAPTSIAVVSLLVAIVSAGASVNAWQRVAELEELAESREYTDQLRHDMVIDSIHLLHPNAVFSRKDPEGQP